MPKAMLAVLAFIVTAAPALADQQTVSPAFNAKMSSKVKVDAAGKKTVNPAVKRKLELLSAANLPVPEPTAIRESVTVDLRTPWVAEAKTRIDLFNLSDYNTANNTAMLKANREGTDQSWVQIAWPTAPGLSYILDCGVSNVSRVKFARFENVGGTRTRVESTVTRDSTGRFVTILPALAGYAGYGITILGMDGAWGFTGCEITPVG